MNRIELPTPIAVGDATVSAFLVRPLFFLDYAEIATKTAEETAVGKVKYETAFQRARMIHQCVGLTAEGAEVRLDDETLTVLPVGAARSLIAALSSDMGKSGVILSLMADGVTAPLLYKLGTPIATGGVIGEDGKEDRSITEIEFFASNFGALEDVLAAITKVDQTVALIEHVAHPVEMLGMPAWAARQITIADGLTIMNEVLPRFLG